jgi:hypothetical protein
MPIMRQHQRLQLIPRGACVAKTKRTPGFGSGSFCLLGSILDLKRTGDWRTYKSHVEKILEVDACPDGNSSLSPV